MGWGLMLAFFDRQNRVVEAITMEATGEWSNVVLNNVIPPLRESNAPVRETVGVVSATL